MRTYYPTEQIELIVIGGKVCLYLRDKLQSISHSFGRPYNKLTDSSLQRIVNVMNNKELCDLEVKKDGRFISIVAWRKYSNVLYSEDEWKAKMAEDDLSEINKYPPDEWG